VIRSDELGAIVNKGSTGEIIAYALARASVVALAGDIEVGD